jgi:hypothetical protein
MVFRDQTESFRQLASESCDAAETWTTPVLTDMPDSRAKQSAGNLPDGTAFLVNAPRVDKRRIPLAITLSRDGRLFDRAWALQARVIHDWFGNPFTYPASLAFALRNGVSPADYDLLSTNRFLSDPLRPYGGVDVGVEDDWLLGEGWHAPERDGPVTFRWAGSPATVRIPLDHAAPLRVQARLHAFAFPGALPQTLTISVNGANPARPGQSCGPLPVTSDWQTIRCTVDAASWRTGIDTLTLQFGYAQRLRRRRGRWRPQAACRRGGLATRFRRQRIVARASAVPQT